MSSRLSNHTSSSHRRLPSHAQDRGHKLHSLQCETAMASSTVSGTVPGWELPTVDLFFPCPTVSFPCHLPEGCQSQTNSCLHVDNFKMFLGYS